MPLHLPSFSRRRFLRGALFATGGALTLRAADGPVDPHRFALLSDTHIDTDPARVAGGINLADHLSNAVADVRALDTVPAGLFINGDCALDIGRPGDYSTFSNLLDPIVGKIPLHLLLGNHDNREVFYDTLREHRPATPLVASKHVSIVETPRANWLLLDSLEGVKKVPGLLGDEQRAWLTKALDERANKPALVMLHHNPAALVDGRTSGLIDTAELFAVLQPRRQVKAVFFGHTHTWRHTQQNGLHLINLPAVAYRFNETEVTGWTDCRLRENGMTLEIRAHDEKHVAHGKHIEFNWRT